MSKLTSSEKKLKHKGGREVGGYLTPTEVVELIKLGYKPTSSILWFIKRRKLGLSNPAWVYFRTNKVF